MPDLWMDVDIALSEVPVNIMPLLDDTDFKTRETAIAYNAAGMDLVWNFVTTGGAFTQTAVTPTTAGNYDWTHQGDGMYTIEIPASGGASINNDTEGFGWFTGLATGVLPWRGPTIGFRAAGLNDALIDSAYSTTRGLAGTALPNAAAEAAGGLYTRGTGAGQINQAANGQIDSNLTTAGGDISSGDGLAALGLAYDTNGYVSADTVRISGDNVAANNAESFFDGTGYAGTNNVIPTVTTLTNLPAITSNWLTAAGIAAGALNGKGDWNIGKTGYALSSAGVQAIWDALTSALTTVGSIGKRVSDYLDVLVSSRASQTSLDTMASDTSTGIIGIKNQTDQFTFSTGGVDASVAAIAGDPTPAANLQADYNGTGYNKENSTIFAATSLTSLESALNIYFAALTRKDAGLAGDIASVFTGINQDYGSGPGAYNNTTDSVEAIRDRGDAAWTTGSGSDPWSTALPGAYGAGTAGKILGDNLNATVSSRASQASLDTLDDLVDTEVSAIKAKTDNLPTDPADQSAIEAAITAATSPLATASALTTLSGLVDDLETRLTATRAGYLDNLSGGPVATASSISALNDLTAQEVRDSMKLTPTAGGGASGSVDFLLAAIAGDVEGIFNDTDEVIPGLIAALNNISAAQVNAEVDTALADIHLDHLLAADYDPANKPGVATALLNELIGNDAGVSQFTANALELAPAGGGGGLTIADFFTDDSGLTYADAVAGSVVKEIADNASSSGPIGSIEFTYTVINTTTSTPLEGASVWISTDLAGANVIWVGVTDAFGVARTLAGIKPFLDPGTYYFWVQKSGYAFTNPDTETVS